MVRSKSLVEIYSGKGNEELIHALVFHHEDYNDKAHSIIRGILRSRGFDLTAIDLQRQEVDLYTKAADWREISTFRVYGCGKKLIDIEISTP